jgi:L-aspartate oxidase
LRGEGAKLVDSDSARIMEGLHPLLELAPRDVVARAIHAAREAGRRVFLDCRESVGAAFPERFPTVYATCIGAGIDPVTDPIPVAPAAHYHMGGIAVDRDGRADIAGLWACGECAATGAHGANRLASNSLLEALVYGHRIAEAVRAASPAPRGQSADPPRSDHRAVEEEEHLRHAASVVRLRRLMTRDVGLLRDGPGLARALAEIDEIEDMSRKTPGEAGVLANMIAAARLTAAAAFARRESRGGHTRTDYPKADDGAARRSFLTLADAALIGDEAAKGPAATG